jgi:hypothetical protein
MDLPDRLGYLVEIIVDFQIVNNVYSLWVALDIILKVVIALVAFYPPIT